MEGNAYGDFMLHRLEKNRAAYQIETSDVQLSKNAVGLDFRKSAYLGRFNWKANRAASLNIKLNRRRDHGLHFSAGRTA
jgi:hypothetical protein